jgi:hypothetical protein
MRAWIRVTGGGGRWASCGGSSTSPLARLKVAGSTQGLAPSGEDHPLPLLWRLSVEVRVGANPDLLASLLQLFLGVRVFVASYYDDE